MNYFNEAKTVADIKYCYRQLAMKFHPDRSGGSTKIMQSINSEYQEALKQANGQQSSNSGGQEFTYRYNPDVESGVMEIIDVLLSMKMESVVINLIGCWVWLTGNTRPYKEDFKAIGCKWHGKRQAWFWHDPNYRSSFNSKDSLPELAERYGVKSFTQPSQQKITLH